MPQPNLNILEPNIVILQESASAGPAEVMPYQIADASAFTGSVEAATQIDEAPAACPPEDVISELRPREIG